MNLLSTFYPSEIKDSTYVIPFEEWKEKGYKGVIFDVDNTLVPHGADADERSIALFQRLKELGFNTMLLSNNKEPRVKRFNEKIGSQYIYKAGKPGLKNYRKAMELMGTTPENTLFVGDQLFTDVWGANRFGIKSILVNPINKKEGPFTLIKRPFEKIILSKFKEDKND